MDERLQRLQAALNRDQLAFNEATVGRTCEVLVERKGKHRGPMARQDRHGCKCLVHLTGDGSDWRSRSGRTGSKQGQTRLPGELLRDGYSANRDERPIVDGYWRQSPANLQPCVPCHPYGIRRIFRFVI